MADTPEDLTSKLLTCLASAEVCNTLQALLKPIITKAVEDAVASVTADKTAEIELLKGELAKANRQINELEQYSRRCCLDISGVPERPDEDTTELVVELSRVVGVQIEKSDIDISHRVGRPSPGKTRKIIVKFMRVSKRQDLYAARRDLRRARAARGSFFAEQVLTKIFISENLTRENDLLLYKARQLRKKGKLFAVWSDQGKLKTRITSGAPTRIFRSLEDLAALVGDDPVLHSDDAPAALPGAARDVDSNDGFRTVTGRRGRSAAKQ